MADQDDRAIDELELVGSEIKTQTRVVCKMFGKAPGHHEHKWDKEGLALTRRYRDKLTDDIAGQRVAAMELPYRIQVRAVSNWNDVPDAT